MVLLLESGKLSTESVCRSENVEERKRERERDRRPLEERLYFAFCSDDLSKKWERKKKRKKNSRNSRDSFRWLALDLPLALPPEARYFLR